MSLCVMSDYISETKPPILMKVCMVLRYVLIWVYAKFQLILPINKHFSLMNHFLGRVAALLASVIENSINFHTFFFSEMTPNQLTYNWTTGR